MEVVGSFDGGEGPGLVHLVVVLVYYHLRVIFAVASGNVQAESVVGRFYRVALAGSGALSLHHPPLLVYCSVGLAYAELGSRCGVGVVRDLEGASVLGVFDAEGVVPVVDELPLLVGPPVVVPEDKLVLVGGVVAGVQGEAGAFCAYYLVLSVLGREEGSGWVY